MYKVKVDLVLNEVNEMLTRRELFLNEDEFQEHLVDVGLHIAALAKRQGDIRKDSLEYIENEKIMEDLTSLIPGLKVKIYAKEIEHPRIKMINMREKETGTLPEYKYLRKAWKNLIEAGNIIQRCGEYYSHLGFNCISEG